MGKRERRRRRERAVTDPLTSAITHRPHVRRTTVEAASAVTCHLAALAVQLRDIEGAVDVEIERLVSLGVGWPVIAAALGVSRQAARQRWLRRQR